MSVIVWDGVSVAADTLCVRGDSKTYSRKIFKIDGYVIGAVGPSDYAEAMLAWLRKNPANPPMEEFPKDTQSKDDFAIGVVFRADEQPRVYDRVPFPTIPLGDKFAVGSGRDCAIVALRLGASVYHAVEVTAECIEGVGGEIHVEYLYE